MTNIKKVKRFIPFKFWSCDPCKAYVGTYIGTTEPFGILANAELRLAKREAHEAFDDLWKLGFMSRSKAYKKLAEYMDLTKKNAI